MQAVRVLYGEGDKPARDKAYAAAMEKIYRDFPDDVEAALFYALSLMGTVSAEDPAGLQTRLRAGAIASEVYKKNPNHPGAAHYVLHAFDDPENAPKALDAARRYAEIAPDAPHALHMPSHIFLQLGMWPEAAASNEASWAASDTWVKQKNLPISKRDYHSLHWLLYIYLQQGRYGKAEALLTQMRQSLAEFPKDDPRNLIFGTFTPLAWPARLWRKQRSGMRQSNGWVHFKRRLRIPSLGPRPAAVLSRCKLPLLSLRLRQSSLVDLR